MKQNFHHVPGRLRIRSRALKCDCRTRGKALREIYTLPGIDKVRLNEKAGSVTIHYDPATTDTAAIIKAFSAYECIQKINLVDRPLQKPATTKTQDWKLVQEAGKIAFNIVVSKGVSYSLSRLYP